MCNTHQNQLPGLTLAGRSPLKACVAWCIVLLAGFAMQAQADSPTEAAVAPVPIVRSADGRRIDDLNIRARDVQVLFVDLQPELTDGSRSIQPQALAANAAVLARVAHLVDVPVTFSIVPMAGKPGRHIPELAQYAGEKNTFPRVVAGTFMEPPLVSALAAQRRKVLIVSGYATEVAVLQTALGALKAGYTVYVPVDAIGSRSSRTESAALREMELAGAIPTSVLALAAQLAPDFFTQARLRRARHFRRPATAGVMTW